MSYDVCVWDPTRHAPLPANDDEALAIMERLSKVGDSFNLLFGELSRALVQHHEASLQAAPAGGKTVGTPDMRAFWGCDPLQVAADCKTAVYRLPLPDEADTEQLAPIVGVASKLGLVVYDDELGMCFLPDGTIYPEDLREGWEADLAEWRAGPQEPRPDNRTWLQTIAYELFNAIGQGNKKIY